MTTQLKASAVSSLFVSFFRETTFHLVSLFLPSIAAVHLGLAVWRFYTRQLRLRSHAFSFFFPLFFLLVFNQKRCTHIHASFAFLATFFSRFLPFSMLCYGVSSSVLFFLPSLSEVGKNKILDFSVTQQLFFFLFPRMLKKKWSRRIINCPSRKANQSICLHELSA